MLSKVLSKSSLVATTIYLGALAFADKVFAQAGANSADALAERARASNTVAGTVKLGKGFSPDIGTLITSVLTFVMLIAALLILMYLIWGGIQWITSGGDKGKTEEARNKITSAVIGLIILAAAWAVFLIILKFLGFSSYQDLFTNIVNVSGT